MAIERHPLPEKPIGEWAKSGIVVSLGGLVAIAEDMLQWEFAPERAAWKNPPENLLDQFSTLWQKPSRSIVAFANKWGPLRIDESGRDINFAALRTGREPLEWWRYLSRRAYAIRSIADALDNGAIGDDADWDLLTNTHRRSKVSLEGEDVLDDPPPAPIRFGLPNHWRWEFSEYVQKFSGYPDPISYAKASIAGEVTSWLRQFDVKLSLQWDESSSWQINMAYGGRMLAAIAHQLALAVAHGERIFRCSGTACGKLYTRPRGTRKPNTGHANFCPDCIKKREPQRQAEQRYRESRRNRT